MSTEPSSRRRYSSGDPRHLITYSKKNRVAKAPTRKTSQHIPSASTIPEIRVTSTSGQSMNAEPTSSHWNPTSSHWNHNDLTKRAYQFIKDYESRTEGWESQHDPQDVNTGEAGRKEEQGTWFCQYATPAGSSSLTILIKDPKGTEIFSYTAASISNARSIHIKVPGAPEYKFTQYRDKVTISNGMAHTSQGTEIRIAGSVI